MKQVIIAVLVVVGIIGGAIVFSGENNVSGSESNNFYGAEDGIVTVTEYADFQCPGCGSFFPIVSQIKEDFKDQVRFEFKHFPLVSIHPNAVAAHRAAEAAARQGQFWEMHDLLFEQQNSWNTVTDPANVFRGYAERLSLNMDQYDADVASSEILNTINADTSKGKELGVSGTPSFFIDGEVIENPTTTINSVETFSARIQQAIDAKSGDDNTETQTQPTESAEPVREEEVTTPEEDEETTE